MALVKGHDYVEITGWECPNCHKIYSGLFKVGRFFGEKLHCNRGCGLEHYPALARNVNYKD